MFNKSWQRTHLSSRTVLPWQVKQWHVVFCVILCHINFVMGFNQSLCDTWRFLCQKQINECWIYHGSRTGSPCPEIWTDETGFTFALLATAENYSSALVKVQGAKKAVSVHPEFSCFIYIWQIGNHTNCKLSHPPLSSSVSTWSLHPSLSQKNIYRSQLSVVMNPAEEVSEGHRQLQWTSTCLSRASHHKHIRFVMTGIRTNAWLMSPRANGLSFNVSFMALTLRISSSKQRVLCTQESVSQRK